MDREFNPCHKCSSPAINDTDVGWLRRAGQTFFGLFLHTDQEKNNRQTFQRCFFPLVCQLPTAVFKVSRAQVLRTSERWICNITAQKCDNQRKKTSSPGHKPIFFCSETWSMITLVVLPSSKFGRCSIKREASSIFSATLRQICRLKLHNWHQHSWEVWVWLQRSEQKSLFQLLNSSTFLYSLAKGGTYSKSITNIWRQHNT